MYYLLFLFPLLAYVGIFFKGFYFPLFLVVLTFGFLIFAKKKGVILVYLIIVFAYFLLSYKYNNDNNFLKNMLFQSKTVIVNSYTDLKTNFFKNGKKIIGKQYKKFADIGYEIYDRHGKLLNWSGRCDFYNPQFLKEKVEIKYKDNEASLRYKIKTRGYLYVFRYFLTNLYADASVKSQWLKKIENRTDTTISFYFYPGQFFIYNEPVSYDYFLTHSDYFDSKNNVLYFLLDGFIVKLKQHNREYYLYKLRFNFFLIILFFSITFLFVFQNKKRESVFFFLFYVFLLNLLLHFISPFFILILALFIYLFPSVKCAQNYDFDIKIFLLMLISGGFVIILAHTGYIGILSNLSKLKWLFGRPDFNSFIFIFTLILLYPSIFVLFFALKEKIKEEVLLLSVFLMTLFVPQIFPFVIFALFFYLFLKKRKFIFFFHGSVFILLGLLYFLPLMERKNEIYLENAKIIENIPKRLLKETVLLSENDKMLLKALKNDIHYDDNNFAFFKWVKTPLSKKQYANFLFFTKKSGKIYSSYSYNGHIPSSLKLKNDYIIASKGYVVLKHNLFYKNQEVGAVVAGIKTDFFLNEKMVYPLFFEHFVEGEPIFSTLSNDDQLSSYYYQYIVKKNGEKYLFYLKKGFLVVSNLLFFYILTLIIVFFIALILSKKKISFLGDFKKRIIFFTYILILFPFIFGTFLIFNIYRDNMKSFFYRKAFMYKEKMIRILLLNMDNNGEVQKDVAHRLNEELPYWSIYKNQKHFLSYDEDSIRLNMGVDYVPKKLYTKILSGNDLPLFKLYKAHFNYYFKYSKFPNKVFRLDIVINKLENELFLEKLINYIVIEFFITFIILFLIYKIIKSILMPLSELIVATKVASYGDFSYKVSVDSKIKEIKILLVNFSNMLKKLSIYKKNIEESTRYLHEIFDSMPLALIIYDNNFHITFYNKIVDKYIKDIKYKADIHQFIPFDLAFDEEGASEYRYKGKIFRFVVRKFKNGYLMLIMDVTKLVIAEKIDTWLQMTQEIAHELKNPLMPINFSLNRLEKKINEFDKEKTGELNELISVIKEEVNSISVLVKKIKELATVGEKELALLDIKKELRKIVKGFSSYQINVKFSSQLPNIYFSKNKFYIIMRNILENSIEASFEKKKIEIFVYYDYFRRKTMVGEIDKNKKYLVIHVRDFAGGIEKELLNRIFEPYFSNKKTGSGLGLYLVKKILDEYNGDIALDIREGEGSDFYLLFEVKGENEAKN